MRVAFRSCVKESLDHADFATRDVLCVIIPCVRVIGFE